MWTIDQSTHRVLQSAGVKIGDWQDHMFTARPIIAVCPLLQPPTLWVPHNFHTAFTRTVGSPSSPILCMPLICIQSHQVECLMCNSWCWVTVLLVMSLVLEPGLLCPCFNGHLPGEPWPASSPWCSSSVFYKRTFGYKWHRCFYRFGALPVTQPIVPLPNY